MERPRVEGDENGIWQEVGDELRFSFDEPQDVDFLRLQLDPDHDRMSISDNFKMRVFCMKLHTGKDFRPVRVAAPIVKDFCVYADGVEIARIEGNYRSLVKVPLHTKAKEISVKWLATNGAEKVHIFSADLMNEE